MNAIALTISDALVRQDDSGRYCLNDLHKAAGGEKRHQPSNWLQVQQTQELINEIEIPGIPGIVSKQGLGTFAVKELVYAYAMWISASFALRVIRAYDALATGRLSLPILPSPRAKKMVKGGLLLEQQDAINDMIKQRLETVPQEDRAGTAIKIYSAINTKFGTKGMKDGYKNIQPEHFDNIIQLIARLPLEGELLESQPKLSDENSIAINLNDGTTMRLSFPAHAKQSRYVVDVFQGNVWIKSLGYDSVIATGEELPTVIREPGVISNRHLPAIIRAAAERMEGMAKQ